MTDNEKLMDRKEIIELLKEYIDLDEIVDIRKLNNLPNTNEDIQDEILKKLELDRFIQDFGTDATHEVIKYYIIPILEKIDNDNSN